MLALTPKKGSTSAFLTADHEFRLKLELGLQQLLNSVPEAEFEQLLFWGKVIGLNKDYYVAMGIKYSSCYEFPLKKFYWASSADFTFQKFSELND